MTEQGEMIQWKFGTPDIAERSFELYRNATLEATLTPPAAPSAAFRVRMDRLAARYDSLLVGSELGATGVDLRNRLLRVERAMLEVLDQPIVLEHSPILRRSFQLRRAYLDPLNLIQAELLRRQREHADAELQDALLATINGIAAGLKNTG